MVAPVAPVAPLGPRSQLSALGHRSDARRCRGGEVGSPRGRLSGQCRGRCGWSMGKTITETRLNVACHISRYDYINQLFKATVTFGEMKAKGPDGSKFLRNGHAGLSVAVIMHHHAMSSLEAYDKICRDVFLQFASEGEMEGQLPQTSIPEVFERLKIPPEHLGIFEMVLRKETNFKRKPEKTLGSAE